MKKLIPLQFIPFLKECIWGGSRLRAFAKQTVVNENAKIGELWGLYDHPDASSVVQSGPFQGRTLHELLQEYGEDLIGKDFPGELFPVTVKILDAKQRLSLQVHPNKIDRKDECWYVMETVPGSSLFAGVKPGCTPEIFWDSIYNPMRLRSILQEHATREHDFFFVKAGCVHALDSGNMVMEIQENCDTTYRISDWWRLDSNGKCRELHLDEAKKFINFSISLYRGSAKRSHGEIILLRDQTTFSLHKLHLESEQERQIHDRKSFHILASVSGDFELEYEGGRFAVPYGDLILVPAVCGSYRIRPVQQEADVLLTKRSSKGYSK